MIPITRTYSPVTKGTVLVVGEPLHLPLKANRQAQREFDFQLVDRLGELVEINVPQILCGLLYVRCLHGKTAAVQSDDLTAAVKKVLDAIEGRRIDPAAQADLGQEILRTLAYLAKQDMARISGREVHPNAAAILAAPEVDADYRAKNPVKYIFNHILHLKDVVAAIENVALDMAEQFEVRCS